MSWCVSGYGVITPKDGGFSQEDLDALNGLGTFKIERWADSYCITFDGNFYTDDVEHYLNELAKKVESGEIEMKGECDSYWRYVIKDGSWDEEPGRIVYNGDYRIPLKLSNEDKLELFGEIIETFENLLSDKGIVINNPEKEQDEHPSNIYGTDYGNLESEIECVLRHWEVIS